MSCLSLLRRSTSLLCLNCWSCASRSSCRRSSAFLLSSISSRRLVVRSPPAGLFRFPSRAPKSLLLRCFSSTIVLLFRRDACCFSSSPPWSLSAWLISPDPASVLLRSPSSALTVSSIGVILPGLRRCRLPSCSCSGSSLPRRFNVLLLLVIGDSGASGIAIADAIVLPSVSGALIVRYRISNTVRPFLQSSNLPVVVRRKLGQGRMMAGCSAVLQDLDAAHDRIRQEIHALGQPI